MFEFMLILEENYPVKWDWFFLCLFSLYHEKSFELVSFVYTETQQILLSSVYITE